jgi:hypothetical protein
MADYDPIVPIRPECKGRFAYGSIVPGWIIAHLQAGKPLVMDQKTQVCADNVLAHAESMKPEKVIWRGLPENFVALSQEWSDPARRSALLARMAASSPAQLRGYFSSHMHEQNNIRLWLGRFKAYIDAIESIALHNVISKPTRGGAADIFYSRF